MAIFIGRILGAVGGASNAARNYAIYPRRVSIVVEESAKKGKNSLIAAESAGLHGGRLMPLGRKGTENATKCYIAITSEKDEP
jgi:hypothetical protein